LLLVGGGVDGLKRLLAELLSHLLRALGEFESGCHAVSPFFVS